MRTSIVTLGGVVAATLGMWVGTAAADSPPGPSYKSLLAGGYEIRAVTLLPVDAAKQLGASTTDPEAVITLQNGTSTAVCTFDFANWYNLSVPSMEGTSQCVQYAP